MDKAVVPLTREMSIAVTIYDPRRGPVASWQSGSRVGVFLDSSDPLGVCIEGNAVGLRSLACAALALSGADLPQGGSINYDTYMGLLRQGSQGFRLEKQRGAHATDFGDTSSTDEDDRPALLTTFHVPVIQPSTTVTMHGGSELMIYLIQSLDDMVCVTGDERGLSWLATLLLAVSHDAVIDGTEIRGEIPLMGPDGHPGGVGSLMIRRA